MLGFSRKAERPASIDLDTVRETLSYMHDDMRSVPGLERVAAALGRAIEEIEATGLIEKPVEPVSLGIVRFLPRRG